MEQQFELYSLLEDMENDIDRYPIPICFDPYEEQKELFGRHQKLKRIAERFMQRKEYQSSIKDPTILTNKIK